jgi:hypothetical protein
MVQIQPLMAQGERKKGEGGLKIVHYWLNLNNNGILHFCRSLKRHFSFAEFFKRMVAGVRRHLRQLQPPLRPLRGLRLHRLLRPPANHVQKTGKNGKFIFCRMEHYLHYC